MNRPNKDGWASLQAPSLADFERLAEIAYARLPARFRGYLNLFLYRKSNPNSPFSSRSATTDHVRLSAHSTRTTCGLLFVMLVI